MEEGQWLDSPLWALGVLLRRFRRLDEAISPSCIIYGCLELYFVCLFWATHVMTAILCSSYPAPFCFCSTVGHG